MAQTIRQRCQKNPAKLIHKLKQVQIKNLVKLINELISAKSINPKKNASGKNNKMKLPIKSPTMKKSALMKRQMKNTALIKKLI